MVIVVGGMIGLGKSSVSKVLGEHFNSEVFYESVDDNPLLPLFYSESEEEALYADNNVLDRSIYEDWYFAKKNMELGRISELEMKIYEDLLENMMEELKEIPKKAPDLMVYLKGSFDTVINRIKLRGREFEVDDSLMEYYKFLWEGYDYWVNNCYSASDVVIIDMDKLDIVNSEEDKKELIRLVEEKLKNRQ